ncbi:MAG: YunC family protein [Thermaerobacter sp.]|nr:YunC family protein [Thermaerobacter sp.]
MCGALDVGLLSEKLRARGIVAARAVGVRTVEELLAAPMESVTPAAAERGVQVGMPGHDAIGRMF